MAGFPEPIMGRGFFVTVERMVEDQTEKLPANVSENGCISLMPWMKRGGDEGRAVPVSP